MTGMGLEIPWVGMDKDACKYMDPPCGEAVGSNGVRSYRFPIDCLQVYPAVSGGIDVMRSWLRRFFTGNVASIHFFVIKSLIRINPAYVFCRGTSN